MPSVDRRYPQVSSTRCSKVPFQRMRWLIQDSRHRWCPFRKSNPEKTLKNFQVSMQERHVLQSYLFKQFQQLTPCGPISKFPAPPAWHDRQSSPPNGQKPPGGCGGGLLLGSGWIRKLCYHYWPCKSYKKKHGKTMLQRPPFKGRYCTPAMFTGWSLGRLHLTLMTLWLK